MILSIFDFIIEHFFLDLKKVQNLCTFYVLQKMNLLPQFFYGMVVIGSLSMVMGAGVGVLGGRWGALGGCWEGVGGALEGLGKALAGG